MGSTCHRVEEERSSNGLESVATLADYVECHVSESDKYLGLLLFLCGKYVDGRIKLANGGVPSVTMAKT